MKQAKTWIAGILIVAMAFTMTLGSAAGTTDAAAAVKLSAKKLTVTKGKTKKLSVKNASKYKISWTVQKKKIASVKKSGKAAAKVTGKKAGTTKVSAILKKGKKTKKLSCTVTVKAKTVNSTPTATAAVTQTPTATPALSMKDSYQGVIDNIGTCLAYNQTWNKRTELQNEDTMSFVEGQFNSFTLENEMKPDNMLGYTANLISTAEAEKLGYVLNDYDETEVPKLNFDMLDAVLKIAKEHGMKIRAHTLMWHSQTPSWFFHEDYSEDGETVDEETMNARLEFYVRTMVSHVLAQEEELTGEAGSIVYAWDVVNEYIHRSGSLWETVYGDMGMEPVYVKRAFEYAYDELEKKNAQDKVTLFSNDYDEYFNAEKEIELINYINKGEKAKICGGIGMQSHLDVDRPTIEEYGEALDTFLASGLEVQITELDITINFDHTNTYNYKNVGQTESDQAEFTKQLMEMIVKKQKGRDKTVSPKGITSLTVWGLYDQISWRSSMEPLFFKQTRQTNAETGKRETVITPKESFYAFCEAAAAE